MVVSLDGGGLRGIVSTMVLIGFENAIKSFIIKNKPGAFPESSKIKRVEEFEVNLADYVDCFAGVSSGGWAALYLASKGEKSPILETFNEHLTIAKYGRMAPGSAKVLLMLYLEYGNTMFPQRMALPGDGIPQDDDPMARGVLRPIYSAKGVEKALRKFFGNTTMADLKTSCVIPAFDLLSRTMTLFIHNHFSSPPRAEVADLRYRLAAKSSTKDASSSHINIRTDVNFYARDIARASGATPIFLPAKELVPVGESATEYISVDGTIGGNSPTLEALVHIANERSMSSFEKLAVLSIGNGVAYEEYEDNANGGTAQWSSSGEMLHLYKNLIGDMINSQIDYWLHSYPKTKPEQFLRIQKFEPLNTVDGFLLASQDKSAYLRELQSIGEGLAESYKDSLDTFVKDFVFAEEESSTT
eukprot:g6512.t1